MSDNKKEREQAKAIKTSQHATAHEAQLTARKLEESKPEAASKKRNTHR